MNRSDSIFGEVIYSYSRAQAIDDGVLVDVSEVAREAGITFPTAMTRSVYEKYVVIPPGVQCQDESGRLWDVVFMLSMALRANRKATDTIRYQLHVRNDNRDRTPPLVTLKGVCGPGDNAEPCVTIMLPEED